MAPAAGGSEEEDEDEEAVERPGWADLPGQCQNTLVFTAMGYPRDSGVEWWQDEMLALFNAPLACCLLSGFGCFSDQGCLQNKKTVMSAKALCRACAGHVCSAHLASIQGT